MCQNMLQQIVYSYFISCCFSVPQWVGEESVVGAALREWYEEHITNCNFSEVLPDNYSGVKDWKWTEVTDADGNVVFQ